MLDCQWIWQLMTYGLLKGAFRPADAVCSLRSVIGASNRARLARMDTAKAVKATAHQLARLIYAMLNKGQNYVEKGIEAFEARSHDRQVRAVLRRARSLGLSVALSRL